MIDLHNKTERGRLMEAIKTSGQALDEPRKIRAELTKDHAGSWYTTHGAPRETLVNKLNQTARIYSRYLAANNPRVKIGTSNPQLWPFAKRFEVGINKLIAEINFDQTLRLVVLDAFYLIGVAKVCMADGAPLEVEQDVWYDPGRPWVGRVSFDDLFLDTMAKELSKMRFAGDRYRAPWSKVENEPSYDPKVVKKLTPTSKQTLDEEDGRASDIMSGSAVDDDELEPMIWLMDVWLPENNSVATFAVDGDHPPLIERPWAGNQGGPYKYLALGYVPDNILPSSPASNLKGLHDRINKVHRKMAEQSDRQKMLYGYAPGEADQANAAREAKDGQYIQWNDPSALTPINFPGVDPNNSVYAISLNDTYDMQAGNLRGMGGLDAQADTATQEQIIQGNISSQMGDYQLQVVQFVSGICYNLGHLMWADELLEIQASEEPYGDGISVDYSWSPQNRQGEFSEYDFKVEPYSMIYTTPAQKLQQIFSTLQQLSPLWPMFQASGATIDAPETLAIISDLLDSPELKRIITFAAPMEQQGGAGGHEATQAPVTTRNTVRRNVPTGGTPDSRSAILQQMLMGGGQTNPDQRASVMRNPA